MNFENAQWHYSKNVYDGTNQIIHPEVLTAIESEGFSGIAAQVIIIPASCVSVAQDAFDYCANLVYVVNRSNTQVTVPAGVTLINENGMN